MKKKYLAIAALSMALAAGSAMTSFAAGFVHTSQGTKYQWGSGDYCTNNWVNYKNHWFFFGEDQIMRTGWILVLRRRYRRAPGRHHEDQRQCLLLRQQQL